MKTEKNGSHWKAYFDPETNRYFAEILYINREGIEQFNYEITKDIYDRLGTFSNDTDNEELIREAKRTYSLMNTMYGTLGPERVVWDEEANELMNKVQKKHEQKNKKENKKENKKGKGKKKV
jgi:flagellar biosynthesis regulator FlbT